MPRSVNRRGLEVPAPLYERLQAEATRDGRTVTQVAVDLLTDGWDARGHHGRVVDELHENRIELERLRRQIADLAAVVRGQAPGVATSPASIPAETTSTKPRRRATRTREVG